jgi:hypothetical protein
MHNGSDVYGPLRTVVFACNIHMGVIVKPSSTLSIQLC